MHGGTQPVGPDNPNFKHGIFSDYMDDGDLADIEAIEGMSNPEALQEQINYLLLKARRAVAYIEGNWEDSGSFYEAFEEVIEEASTGDGIGSEEIRELANFLDSGDDALLQLMGTIR